LPLAECFASRAPGPIKYRCKLRRPDAGEFRAAGFLVTLITIECAGPLVRSQNLYPDCAVLTVIATALLQVSIAGYARSRL